MSVRGNGRWASLTAAVGVVVVAGSLVTGLSATREARWTCEGRSMTAAEIAAARGVPVDKLDTLWAKRDLTPDDICTMPAKKLARALYKIEHPAPDHPGEAAAWRTLRMKDENGRIPIDGVTRALDHVAAMPRPGAVDGFSSQQISRTSWTSLGPGNVGGRIRTIAFHPTDSQTIWIGAVAGGIWKTTNGGASWTSGSRFLANMAVSSIVFDPVTPTTMYAGTGEGFYNGDAARGAGILKTINGGGTWHRITSTATTDFQYVNRLAISPNGTVILAATRTGLFRSTDGGAHWRKALANEEVLDVRFHPTSNTAAIAGGRNGKAWRTGNGGASWVAASGLPSVAGFEGRVELSYAKSSPSIVYASVDVNDGEVWRSTNGGASYTLRSTGKGYLSGQGWYGNTIWVSPTNYNHVIVGGLDLWRSTNGGAAFTQISQWWSAPTQSAHADHHFIAAPPNFDGSTVKTLYFANDGGMYKANDYTTVTKTSGWRELNNKLGVTQFYSVAVNPTTREVIGGTQDNGTLFYKPTTGSEAWGTTYGGDGGWSAADPTDPNFFYGEYVYLNLHRSSDRGVSAQDIYDGIDDAYTSCANFIAPFVLDPNSVSRMLAGGCSLWRSTNVKASAPTWTAIKPTNGDDPISAIAVAPSNSAVVYVGHNNGDVFKSTNATSTSPTWTKIVTGLPTRYVSRITVSPIDANVVYVSFGGFSAQNVWKSANGGASWVARSGSGASALPSVPVYSLVVHPMTPTTLYVGTEIGVFHSTDDGVTWTSPSTGPSATPVDELVFAGTTLYAATHGRGIYKSETQ
jgi:photosystem II stability/assembly factor-like uncharacterized protein